MHSRWTCDRIKGENHRGHTCLPAGREKKKLKNKEKRISDGIYRIKREVKKMGFKSGKIKKLWTVDCGLWTKRGFTLIELMIAVGIIGLLLTMAIPNYYNSIKKGRDAQRKQDIHNIQTILALYYADKGEYPLSGGASSPGGGWSNSSDSSWDTLQTTLAEYGTLPKDPLNETGGWAGNGKCNYSFYSQLGGCSQQWYMLVYKLEAPGNEVSPGVTACNGDYYNYGGTGTMTVGMSG
ncbi:MAG: prepilin-type N-terminal cleavage/methylation domain-containing protein [Candidatus Ratteibacteria bacterium]|nr:prepilin-type N-terminal cleavage/methylation domain-containing protein [Candidatus Ratteibacteria bacterium]